MMSTTLLGQSVQNVPRRHAIDWLLRDEAFLPEKALAPGTRKGGGELPEDDHVECGG